MKRQMKETTPNGERARCRQWHDNDDPAPIGESEDPRGCVIEDLEASNPNYASAWEVYLLVHMMMRRRTIMMLMLTI